MLDHSRNSPRLIQSQSVEASKHSRKPPPLTNCMRQLDLSAVTVGDDRSMLEINRVNPNLGSRLTSALGSVRSENDEVEVDWEKKVPREEIAYMEEEEFESAAPAEGDTLTLYKVHKQRVADRSGTQLPVPPKKEKAVPLKPPSINQRGALANKL